MFQEISMKLFGKDTLCHRVTFVKYCCEISINRNTSLVSFLKFPWKLPGWREKKKSVKFGPGNFTAVEFLCTFRELIILSSLPFWKIRYLLHWRFHELRETISNLLEGWWSSIKWHRWIPNWFNQKINKKTYKLVKAIFIMKVAK